MKHSIISLLILNLFSVNITFSQVAGDRKEFPVLPTKPRVEPTLAQLEAWNSFQDACGSSWQVR